MYEREEGESLMVCPLTINTYVDADTIRQFEVVKEVISNIRSIRLQKAKVFVQARDLGMVWTANKNNYDPEWLPGTNKPSTSFTFGASFNF